MAYIGKSPDGTGVRSRFYFTATGGETSLSGTDDNNATLVFADGAYVDVYLNGVLLVAGTDYNTSTANTIAGLTALAANDIVEILVFDIFTVADTVSASSGGTFNGGVNVSGDLTVDTNTLKVDAANNRVGISTASPAVEAHIQTSSGNPELRIESTGANYATVSFKNSSRHYSTQIRTDQSNAYVIRDETAGANRFLIDTSGNIIAGKTSADVANNGFQFNPGTASFVAITNSSSGAGDELLFLRRTGLSGSGNFIEFTHGSSLVGSISANGSNTAYNTSSDHRLKEAVVDMTGAITRVKQLAPKRFNFIADDSVTVDGFLAHEAQTVVPEAVTGTHNEVDADGNPVYQGIDQSKLVPLLTAALKESIAKIETLEAKVTALENA